ncbi:hypothetical protein ST37_07275 [Vibrio sp. qd031]|uniref:fibro-slime domain-containing protein n=1 Tax=Vibrio sp. qd031 TaxID=1603038 RepID=UPI000A0F8668|nr:fibro-slime domain-containing protein [Vibrio sp. qd031]ORT51145.1 hypothetical protein ST37_07275 [Vibrio sp. qd031]
MRKLTLTAIGISLFFVAEASASVIELTGTIRDFNDTHPDMQYSISGLQTGIVESTLGVDGKPVFVGGSSVTTADNFNQWYNDTPGVNMSKEHTITLNETFADSGIYSYSSSSFFPIDGMLLGNQGRGHNYHFTYELGGVFTYELGQTLSFEGDDDVWVFIDGELVLDLGGVHSVEGGLVDLDTLGLDDGEDYSWNFFFAERHTTQSNFTMQVSIQDLSTTSTDIPEPEMLALLSLTFIGLGMYRRREEKRRA